MYKYVYLNLLYRHLSHLLGNTFTNNKIEPCSCSINAENKPMIQEIVKLFLSLKRYVFKLICFISTQIVLVHEGPCD